MITIYLSENFRYPAGRYKSDGPASGELLREQIVEALADTARVTVDLDGVVGHPSGFMEEAFGGLVRMGIPDLDTRLTLISQDADLKAETLGYIENAVGRLETDEGPQKKRLKSGGIDD